jgi:Family of unknown function (DUF6166)
MKLYRGVRTTPGYKPIVYVDDQALDIGLSKILIHDYDADFVEWGYYGAGPSQTAAAILYDITANVELTKTYHQDFKREFIANFEQDGFVLLESQVRTWLEHRLNNKEER